MKKNVTILFVLVLVSAAVFQAFTSKPKTELEQNNNATLKKEVLVAPRPPMGWNSLMLTIAVLMKPNTAKRWNLWIKI